MQHNSYWLRNAFPDLLYRCILFRAKGLLQVIVGSTPDSANISRSLAIASWRRPEYLILWDLRILPGEDKVVAYEVESEQNVEMWCNMSTTGTVLMRTQTGSKDILSGTPIVDPLTHARTWEEIHRHPSMCIELLQFWLEPTQHQQLSESLMLNNTIADHHGCL
ncbi:hypothetical protein EJ05DRAFT_477177 [Pseudovirgaria hyperparasitica]|uniref:Uncharacterized protein n=1 Tax=Pseudovirgaria hyperparasitica TaxID=470096 RepID=A0A6A6W7A5_9PEZI|nr:uncharacterized protein EJ05DRAFT_477177 [Pseudovirgaria hyperparasitica]KAF2756961.1 hypothetical protein EJ05DRAFT_477177 [Pseudovirgaria hyperparasitica]